jgi:hypothetical protein
MLVRQEHLGEREHVNITTKTTKADLAKFLTDNGLKVEGDEKRDELMEAARYLERYLEDK